MMEKGWMAGKFKVGRRPTAPGPRAGIGRVKDLRRAQTEGAAAASGCSPRIMPVPPPRVRAVVSEGRGGGGWRPGGGGKRAGYERDAARARGAGRRRLAGRGGMGGEGKRIAAAAAVALVLAGGLPGPAAGFASFQRLVPGGRGSNADEPALPWDADAAGWEVSGLNSATDLPGVPLPTAGTQGASSRLEPPTVGGGEGGETCAPPVMIFDFDGVLKYGTGSPGVAAREITESFLDMGFHIAVATGSDFADYKQEFVQEKVSRRAFPDELWRSGAFVKNCRDKDIAISSIMDFFGQRCEECVILFDDSDYRWAARRANAHLVRVGGGRGLLPQHFAQALQYLESKCLAPK